MNCSYQPIPKLFYERNTLDVLPDILGCIVHRRLDDGSVLSGKIVEAEAYTSDDPSCHAYKGRTPRSETLFGECGHAYVYLIYGMYNCFNIVAHSENKAGGLLIRGIEPLSKQISNTNGPGKLCRELNITRELNAVRLTSSGSPLFITFGETIPQDKIVITTRIGIKVAQDYPWRYYIKDNPFVSVKEKKK